MESINIAIFASGSGTNAENIITYLANKEGRVSFKEDENSDKLIVAHINVSLVLSNKSDAFVLERAKKHNIKSQIFTASELREGDFIDNILKEHNISYIILAGFLLKFPDRLVSAYRGKILNLHPSLLPKFGGKGMYGDAVHKAVIESGERESGITIHLVDEHYDNGEHLFQARCAVEEGERPETLAKKIHDLEREYLPDVIFRYILSRQ
jgi:phosphoribosylglycinamide formyltransferase-1